MGSSQVSQKWPSASCHSVAPEAPSTHSELGEQADSWAAERRENFSACCRHRCTQTPAFKLIPPLGLEQRWSHWPPVSFGDALQHFSECSRRRNADNFLETAQWSEQPEHPSPSQQCRGLQLLQFYFNSSNVIQQCHDNMKTGTPSPSTATAASALGARQALRPAAASAG